MTRVERYIEWIDSWIGGVNSYHRDKENRAWIATAFYWTSIVVLTLNVPDSLPWFTRILLAIALLLASLGVLIYVHMQFEVRWIAHDEVIALTRLKGDLLERPILMDGFDTQFPLFARQNDWAVRVPQIPFAHYPNFIQDRINAGSTRSGPSQPRLFCKALPRLLWPFVWRKIDPRLRSEVASYTVIAAGTLIALAIILLPLDPKTVDDRHTSPYFQTQKKGHWLQMPGEYHRFYERSGTETVEPSQ